MYIGALYRTTNPTARIISKKDRRGFLNERHQNLIDKLLIPRNILPFLLLRTEIWSTPLEIFTALLLLLHLLSKIMDERKKRTNRKRKKNLLIHLDIQVTLFLLGRKKKEMMGLSIQPFSLRKRQSIFSIFTYIRIRNGKIKALDRCSLQFCIFYPFFCINFKDKLWDIYIYERNILKFKCVSRERGIVIECFLL